MIERPAEQLLIGEVFDLADERVVALSVAQGAGEGRSELSQGRPNPDPLGFSAEDLP
jgi:hypothetical protein